jgi:hypothetical protein
VKSVIIHKKQNLLEKVCTLLIKIPFISIFEVFMDMGIHIIVFWVMTLYSLVGSTRTMASINETTLWSNSDHSMISLYCLLLLYRMYCIMFKTMKTLKFLSKICNHMFLWPNPFSHPIYFSMCTCLTSNHPQLTLHWNCMLEFLTFNVIILIRYDIYFIHFCYIVTFGYVIYKYININWREAGIIVWISSMWI